MLVHLFTLQMTPDTATSTTHVLAAMLPKRGVDVELARCKMCVCISPIRGGLAAINVATTDSFNHYKHGMCAQQGMRSVALHY
jgi:hypothetical protein